MASVSRGSRPPPPTAPPRRGGAGGRWIAVGSTSSAALLISLLVTACVAGDDGTPPAETTPPVATSRILWIASDESDAAAVEEGLRAGLDGHGVELVRVIVDGLSAGYSGDEDARVGEALAKIEELHPEVIVTTGDGALRHVVIPWLGDSSIPVVFAGVGWAEEEGRDPAPNVTGMVAVELAEQLVDLLLPHAGGDRVGLLTGGIPGESSSVDAYKERFFDGDLSVEYAATYLDFQRAFHALQEEVDVLLLGDVTGIDGWDDEEAEGFVLDNTRIPTGSHHVAMAPFALATLTSPGEEQGEWAAAAALQILDGTPASDIAVAHSQQGRLIINATIAGRLLVELPTAVLRNAEIYGRGSA